MAGLSEEARTLEKECQLWEQRMNHANRILEERNYRTQQLERRVEARFLIRVAGV